MDRVSLLREIRSQRPEASFDEILPACQPETHGSLVELACIDLIDRLRSGAAVRVEEYVAAVPDLNRADDVLELIDAEVCVRQELGCPADREELLNRFPEHAAAIERMFVLDEIESQLQSPARLRDSLPQVEGYRLTNRLVTDTSSTTFRALADDKNPCLLRLFNDGSRDQEKLVEAVRAAAKLQHPAVIKVQRIHVEGNSLFYTMPFTDGTPLRSLIARPVEARQAAGWLKSLATAMAFANHEGTGLGTLSAEQVLIDHHDHARILGMGEPDTDGTKSQVMVGFGQLFFEVLTGTPFTEDATDATLSKPQFDKTMSQICQRCLRHHTDTQYGGMEDVVDALTDFIAGRNVEHSGNSFLSRLLRKK